MKRQGKEGLPEIRATATSMLPGMYQARFMVSLSIGILEYFDRNLVRDDNGDTVRVKALAPEDLRKDVRRLLALIHLFEQLQKQPS